MLSIGQTARSRTGLSPEPIAGPHAAQHAVDMVFYGFARKGSSAKRSLYLSDLRQSRGPVAAACVLAQFEFNSRAGNRRPLRATVWNSGMESCEDVWLALAPRSGPPRMRSADEAFFDRYPTGPRDTHSRKTSGSSSHTTMRMTYVRASSIRGSTVVSIERIESKTRHPYPA